MIKETVKNKILEIRREFEENHHKFLGEEDIRCHLFSKLLDEFNNLETTEDGKQTIPLHAQISFFDEERKLKRGEKPDVLLIDVPTTNLYSDGKINYKDRASKGFEFEKAPIGIEIKINWKRKKANTVKNHLSKVMDKINKVRERNTEMFFYIVYFDKNGRLTEEDITCLNKDIKNIEIIYGSGGS